MRAPTSRDAPRTPGAGYAHGLHFRQHYALSSLDDPGNAKWKQRSSCSLRGKVMVYSRQRFGLSHMMMMNKKPPSFSTVLEHVRRYPPKLCLLARHCAEPYSPMRTSPEIPSAPIDPVNT